MEFRVTNKVESKIRWSMDFSNGVSAPSTKTRLVAKPTVSLITLVTDTSHINSSHRPSVSINKAAACIKYTPMGCYCVNKGQLYVIHHPLYGP